MMYCSTCGKEIADTASFCNHCGNTQSSLSAPALEAANGTAPQPNFMPPPTMPPQQPPKKKLHWLWKDRIARVVCTLLVGVLIIPAIRHFRADPITNSDGVAILNATHPYTTTTYEEAFGNFFEKPKWEFIGSDEAGGICVEFTGKCLYDNQKVDALIQLTIDKESREIWCNYASFNDVSQSLLIANALIDKAFEPYFIPELVEAAQQKAEQEMDAAIDAWSDELQSNLEENIEKEFGSEYATASSTLSASGNSTPALSSSESPTQLEYTPAWTGDLVAIDYIGMTVGEVIAITGENFTLPEEGITGSRVLYYEDSPYVFLFNPVMWEYPSDEDIIVAVIVMNGGWISNDIPSYFNQHQIRETLGMDANADIENFMIGNNKIVMEWDSPDLPAYYITVKGI